MLLPRTCGHKGVIAQQFIGAQHLIPKVEQTTLVQDRAVGAQRCAELPMLRGEQIYRIGIRGKLPLQIKIRSCCCGASRFARLGLQAGRKLLDLIGTERLILCAREVAGDVAEEARRIAEWQESLEAKFKEMLAKEQNDFGAPQHAQLAGEAEPMCIGAEQLIAKGVEGFDWGCGVAVGNEAIHAALHLFSRTLSKGERQDLFRFGALFGDEPGDAARDDLRLPCARTGDDEERTLTVRDGGVLLVV